MSVQQISFNDLQRYSRHLLLLEVNKKGQEKLINSKVLIVGLGGLGSPVSMYLAAAGIRNLSLIDVDSVDISNLQRQIVHTEKSVGEPKVMSAARTLENLDSKMNIQVYHEKFGDNNCDIVEEYDVVVDCLDNFSGKLLINDACYFSKTPFVHGGVLRFGGQVSSFDWKSSHACLRCVVPTIPPSDIIPTCSRVGVLGAAVGVIGSVQALEVIKLIVGLSGLTGKMFMFDSLKNGTYTKTINLLKDKQCKLCGENPTIEFAEEEAPPVCNLSDKFLM